MAKRMITLREARQVLAERGVEVSRSNFALLVRSGRVPGAQLTETLSGPVWLVPADAVAKFEPLGRGWPKGKPRKAADVEMPLKPGPVPKQPAATTRAMNTAFKQAAADGSPTIRKRSTAKASASNGASGKGRKGGKQ